MLLSLSKRMRTSRLILTVLVLDYYLAAILLLIAGILKARDPGISDLLQTLYEQDILSFQCIIFIDRYQHWPELLLVFLVFIGWRARFMACLTGGVYLAFSGLILYASEGYLFFPIDCGCFGTGEGIPAYLLLLRNMLIAFPLFFFSKSCSRFTLWATWKRKKTTAQ